MLKKGLLCRVFGGVEACFGGVLVMFRWCLGHVLCLGHALMVSLSCFGCVSVLLVLSEACFCGVSGLGGLSAMFRMWFWGVGLGHVLLVSQTGVSLVVSELCFGGVLVMFRWCLDSVLVVSRSCFDGVSVMWCVRSFWVFAACYLSSCCFQIQQAMINY